MIWTRRRFLLAAGLVPSAAMLKAEPMPAGAPVDASSAPYFQHDDPAYLIGDPYLAGVDDPGLGGRSFAQARERALRFRTPASERDCHALGVEPDGA